MLLFDSIVFGAFVGLLTHFWLTLAEMKPKVVLILTIAVAVIVAVVVFLGNLAVF